MTAPEPGTGPIEAASGDVRGPRQHGHMDEAITEAADTLRFEHHTKVQVEDRSIIVLDPVKGDPGGTVLRVLASAQAAPLVGAAAHGANGVSIGVWRAPDLYVARWIKGRRWVAGYRLTGGSRLSDYVGTEGHVPTRLETGNWYGSLPDEITELFLEAGLLVDDPPFPVPKPPAAPAPVIQSRPAAAARPSRPAPRPASAGRDPSGVPSRAPAPPSARARGRAQPATRLCAECRMHKAASQFVAGSDLCVDCRAS